MKTQYEALLGVAELDNEYARKRFMEIYVVPLLEQAYGKGAPIHLLGKLILMSYAKQAICNIYGLKSLSEITDSQAKEFNTIIPLFKINNKQTILN